MIESEPFITWVNGRDHQSLTALITDDGMGLVSRPDFIPEEAEALAVTAIRSAIKTILVTQFVWGDKIALNANG